MNMDESRRLAMRRAHARRPWYCTCGKTVHGNGGRTAHSAKHRRARDGHYYMTVTEYERRAALSRTHPEPTASGD